MADTFYSFLLICIVVELTPGPNMAYLTMVSSTQGKKAGFFMVAGIAAGLLTVGLLATVSGTSMLLKNPEFHQLIRIAGTIYLLWLAWDNWKSSPDANNVIRFEYRAFWRGFITNLLNPKAVLFYVTILPAFVNPHRSGIQQTIILLMVYVMIATLIHSMITILGSKFSLLLNRPGIAKISRYGFTSMLFFIALWFFLTTRKLA